MEKLAGGTEKGSDYKMQVKFSQNHKSIEDNSDLMLSSGLKPPNILSYRNSIANKEQTGLLNPQNKPIKVRQQSARIGYDRKQALL